MVINRSTTTTASNSSTTTLNPTSKNYILSASVASKAQVQGYLKKLQVLTPIQRILTGALLGVFFFWPLLLLSTIIPGCLLLAALAYTFIFGFDKFVGDVEETLAKDYGVSPGTIKAVHENADMIKAKSKQVLGWW